MKKVYYVCLLLVAIVSCKKSSVNCSEDRHTYYNISEYNRASIPYSPIKDTLVFVSNQNDTSVLYSKERKQYYYNTSSSYSIDCGDNVMHLEQNEYLFTGSNPDLNTLTLSYGIDKNYIYFSNTGTLNCKVFNQEVVYTLDFLNDGAYYSSAITYKGNKLNGRYVSKYIQSINDSLGFFYNNQYGLMQIKLVKGKTWTLVN